MTDPDRFDVEVRKAIADAIRRRGAVPSLGRVAEDIAAPEDEVRASFDRMIAGHVFIPQRGSSEIYAYDPFCVEKTDFRVRADGRAWWAICGWDALGIPAALGVGGTVETHCPDCGDRVVVDIDRDGTPTSASGAVLHVGVPAKDFWNDIYFT